MMSVDGNGQDELAFILSGLCKYQVEVSRLQGKKLKKEP